MGAVDKIHEFLRFGSVLGLERMNILMEKLGNPQEELKVIHVAGTNGKGSICRYVYQVLQAAGYKCGLYTSPYLEVFNERIEYNESYISDKDLDYYTEIVLEKTKEMVEEGYESPTEFEVVTAVAFLYFKEKKSDYVVLEVGLGGTGDSTNIIKAPLCCIIASISLDHTDRLGDTIAAIAREKAGIIKEGVPCVVSTDREDALAVFEEVCSDKNSKLYKSSEIEVKIQKINSFGSCFNCNIFDKSYEIEISMAGKHQIQNAVAALYGLNLLINDNKVIVNSKNIKDGFRKAKQIGRFEIMRENPYVIIDGAHNPDGSLALLNAIKNDFADKKILMVTGILADKDIDEVFDNFTQITSDFVATQPDNPRRLPAGQLCEILKKRGANCISFDAPEDAVNYAKSQYDNYDLILFAGSLYLIGMIRGLLNE